MILQYVHYKAYNNNIYGTIQNGCNHGNSTNQWCGTDIGSQPEYNCEIIGAAPYKSPNNKMLETCDPVQYKNEWDKTKPG